jgi:chromosomal replication initiator protein
MARADKTQEEFFHTFNTLFESGKQIIISADCPAARITSMDERLKSRFAQGMTVELTAPCYEMRMAILRQKIQSWKKNLLSDEVLDFLARNITKSVRTLEGALVRTGIAASLNNTCPTIASLRSDLADLMNLKPSTGVSIADIKQRVANEFGIRVEDLDSRRRLASLAHPRQVAMFLARKHTSSSLQDIGAAFGRDHSTVLHALRSVETKLETDAPLRHMVEQFAETFA